MGDAQGGVWVLILPAPSRRGDPQGAPIPSLPRAFDACVGLAPEVPVPLMCGSRGRFRRQVSQEEPANSPRTHMAEHGRGFVSEVPLLLQR